MSRHYHASSESIYSDLVLLRKALCTGFAQHGRAGQSTTQLRRRLGGCPGAALSVACLSRMLTRRRIEFKLHDDLLPQNSIATGRATENFRSHYHSIHVRSHIGGLSCASCRVVCAAQPHGRFRYSTEMEAKGTTDGKEAGFSARCWSVAWSGCRC
jgi:hypothetical protein